MGVPLLSACFILFKISGIVSVRRDSNQSAAWADVQTNPDEPGGLNAMGGF